jgi:glycosyltransferase involved in cell wall biosynthesis
LEHGKNEGRAYAQGNCTPGTEGRAQYSECILECEPNVFDANYYYLENPDTITTGVDAFTHYSSYGEKEGRKPNANFDPTFYWSINADVRNANLSAFDHYQSFGFYEGRLPKSPLDSSNRKVSHSKRPLLFVGHDGIRAGSEVVLLEIIKWFHNHTNRKLKLLLLSPGPLANQYTQYSEVYVLPEYTVDNRDTLAKYLEDDFELAYINTVASGLVFILLEQCNIHLQCDVITHIHEMEKVLASYPDEHAILKKHTTHWISASLESTKTLVEKHQLDTKVITTVSAFIQPVTKEDDSLNKLKNAARQSFGVDDNAFVIAGCGTVYWRKGPDIFVEAARRIKSESDREFEFIWFGDGPDLEELRADLSDEEKLYIRFVGSKPDSNALLAMADVFFLPSREDPFPLVVLEAAQHGIPTVCFTEATGITEFVQSDAGISVDRIDAGLAADAIQSLMINTSKLRQLGNCAKERVLENYTSERQCLKIYSAIEKHTSYTPSVSVIVPFYNHEIFVEERVASILNQDIKDIEIILMDDMSSDETASKFSLYQGEARISSVINDNNSGSPFKQWKKGLEIAQSNVIWFAEGDDACDGNFISTLLPYFDDPMMSIAAANTEIITENGEPVEGALKPYLDRAYTDKFESSYVNDGFQEVNESFGAMCTLVNASALLIRRSSLGDSLNDACDFKMCGDWLVYLNCLKGGKIAYDVNTNNYFRRHTNSAVHKIEGSEVYFSERQRVTQFVVDNYAVSRRIVKKAFQSIEHEWDRFKYKHPDSNLADLFDTSGILQSADIVSSKPHVGFYVHGILFSKGGVERLVTDLANHLVERGYRVTLYCRAWGNSRPTFPLYESVTVKPIFNEDDLDSSTKQLKLDLISSDIDVFIPMLSEWLFEPIIDAVQETGISIIASEHNDPWKIEELWWQHDKRIDYFNKADKVHLLLNKFKESLPDRFHQKIEVIPNGVKIPDHLPDSTRDNIIVGVGRLENQKRFDRLIDAAGLIQDKLRNTGWRIEIYGDGSQRNKLQGLINNHGIDDIVLLKGLSDGISDIYKKSSIYVIPSEFEGFGIALVEAMSFGLPGIGFSNCNGPNEIIRNDVDGLLVDDIEGLATAISSFISMDTLDGFRINAFERSHDYSMNNFYASWKNVINNVVTF